MNTLAFSFIGEAIYSAVVFGAGFLTALFFARRNAKLAAAITTEASAVGKSAANAVEKKI